MVIRIHRRRIEAVIDRGGVHPDAQAAAVRRSGSPYLTIPDAGCDRQRSTGGKRPLHEFSPGCSCHSFRFRANDELLESVEFPFLILVIAHLYLSSTVRSMLSFVPSLSRYWVPIGSSLAPENRRRDRCFDRARI